MENQQKDTEAYRDSIATVDKEGKRIWIYPKKPSGKFYKYRTQLSYLLLLVLFVAPFINIGGNPLIQFNIIERKFSFFGQVFWPQDFHLFVFAMITMVVFIILFTVVFGRIFCGWICPQTIFMEMLFRKIEYFIEGDWQQQKALNKKKWTRDYVLKKTTKYALFLLISFHIANTFLAYIIGGEELFKITMESPSQHTMGLTAISVFTLVFYGVFAKLREQVCTTICPYGRMQGVLMDRNTVVVAYDYVRGESRAKVKKGEDRKSIGKGDCIDCGQCVNVCPTGIDIRNGTQLECINCTACIDACDFMMEKVGQDPGLIKYASESNIADGKSWEFTKRAKAYTVVLILLIGIMIALLMSRTDVETTILRTPGMLYQDQGDNKVSNLYNYKVVNKTKEDLDLNFKLENAEGQIKYVGDEPEVKMTEVGEGAFFLIVDKNQLTGMKTRFKIGVYHDEEKIETITTTFVGPTN